MKEVSIAVVILNWNGQALLEKFLPSVINYSQFPNTTIYVADNASSDESIKWLEENYPNQVEIIRNDGNYGFAKGYNVALQKLKEKYFILLNSDVEVTENWLQPMVDLMERNSDTAACQPKILSYEQKDHFEYAGACGGFIDKYGYPFCRGRIFDSYEKDEAQYNEPIDIFWASGACLMVRSNLFFESEGFEEDFFAHMEEIDLCWRLQRMGHKIKVCPSATVYHLGGGTLQKVNPKKTYLNFRNNRLMLTKNIEQKHFISNLLIRDILDIVAFTQALITGKFKEAGAIARALFHFHSMLPKWIKKRKQLQSKIGNNATKSTIYQGSILHQFFIKKHTKFNELS